MMNIEMLYKHFLWEARSLPQEKRDATLSASRGLPNGLGGYKSAVNGNLRALNTFYPDVFNYLGLDVTGIEGSIEAIAASPVSELIYPHDFTTGPFRTESTFDLIFSIEFLEHIEERFLQNVFDLFERGKVIVFTAAKPGQSGYHHVTLRPIEWWVAKFSDRGFTLDERLTKETRARGHVYYEETGTVMRKTDGIR